MAKHKVRYVETLRGHYEQDSTVCADGGIYNRWASAKSQVIDLKSRPGVEIEEVEVVDDRGCSSICPWGPEDIIKVTYTVKED